MVIKYIGSKRKLVDFITKEVNKYPKVKSVADVFSGTTRVGQAFKSCGYQVFSNDINAYSHTLGVCYVQSDKGRWDKEAANLITEFNSLPGSPGYFTETFCIKSKFFHPKNGERVDSIREKIEEGGFGLELKSILLTSLMEAADRVDSTTGVQMAYLKNWAARASNDLQLRLPTLLPRAAAGKGKSYNLDALDFASNIKADAFYLDPPYNQHSYLGNYHIWESLVLWDKPEVYGKACKRVDCKERKSSFNSKREYKEAFVKLVDSINAPFIFISFNNEGYWPKEDMENLLSSRGELRTLTFDYKRYVGAQIGIHNLKGEKVGEVSHLTNKEYLYILER